MNGITTEALLNRILCADAGEVRKILDTVTERYAEVFSNLELLTVSAPASDAKAQAECLHTAARLLEAIEK